MILIKDRHKLSNKEVIITSEKGKYDTYKGSTHQISAHGVGNGMSGKYDTYKGSTLIVATDNKNFFMGKYDTYKGSTLARVVVSDFWIC